MTWSLLRSAVLALSFGVTSSLAQAPTPGAGETPKPAEATKPATQQPGSTPGKPDDATKPAATGAPKSEAAARGMEKSAKADSVPAVKPSDQPATKGEPPKPAEKPADSKSKAVESKSTDPKTKPAEKPATPKPAEPARPAADPKAMPATKPGDKPGPMAGQSKPADSKSGAAKPAEKKLTLNDLPDRGFVDVQMRTIGPTSAGGRVVDVEVVPSDPNTFYVASASGGVFKTVNHGTTFTPVFEREGSACIGDVAVAPSNPNIVWIGTGENNARNSVSWGDGVYKSIDAGKTWKRMGLEKTFQIGKIQIDPTNPDIVYVGALGRLWGDCEHRGVYKTVDGGKTWTKSLFINNQTGIIDLQMMPGEPNTMLAAAYERRRDEFDSNDPIKRWGPGSGLYRTTDAGKTWKKVTEGLPSCQIGRIGLSWFEKYPKVVYAIIETEKSGMSDPSGKRPPGPPQPYVGIEGQTAGEALQLTRVVSGGPADQAKIQAGDSLLSLEGKPVKRIEEVAPLLAGKKPGDKVTLKIKRGEETRDTQVTLGDRLDFQAASKPLADILGGQVANVQDRQGPEGHQTGGVFRSTDGGETWKRVNSLTPRPFYFSQVRVDPSDDRYVYVLGINIHTSADGGKTFKTLNAKAHPDHHALWIDPRDGKRMILGCDGGIFLTHDRMETFRFIDNLPIAQLYHVAVDSRKPYRVYFGLQDNGSWGGPSSVRGRGILTEDWTTVSWGDGFQCAVDPNDSDTVYTELQNGVMFRTNMKTGEQAVLRPNLAFGVLFRWNWNTPFILSSHNGRIHYSASNVVHRSLDRGRNMRTISPNITRTPQGSATALAESPVNPDVLFVGTDDGALQTTRNGGKDWVDLTTEVLKHLPGPRYVTAIVASRVAEGRVYVAFDGHRSNDDQCHLLVSEDSGKTWKSIRGNLPLTSARCLVEDRVNAELLWLGTEFGLWASPNRGGRWLEVKGNLPTVAVHMVAQPTTADEVVLATHGRGVWIVDASGLRGLTDKVMGEGAGVFAPPAAFRWGKGPPVRMTFSSEAWQGQSQSGTSFSVLMTNPNPKSASLKITDLAGKTVRDLTIPKGEGLHAIPWDLRGGATNPIGAMFGGGRRTGGGGNPVKRGTYRITLTVDGKSWSKEFEVEPDPELGLAAGGTMLFGEDEAADEADETGLTPLEREVQQLKRERKRDLAPAGAVGESR